jgi:hypothetical protein
MGAQSDFIAEQFAPSESYRAEQLARARELLASGVDAEELAKMFLLPVELPIRDDAAK